MSKTSKQVWIDEKMWKILKVPRVDSQGFVKKCLRWKREIKIWQSKVFLLHSFPQTHENNKSKMKNVETSIFPEAKK